MNPIENLCSILKTKVAYRRPRKIKDLIKAINKEWNNLPNELSLRLSTNMKNRIEALIGASGHYNHVLIFLVTMFIVIPERIPSQLFVHDLSILQTEDKHNKRIT